MSFEQSVIYVSENIGSVVTNVIRAGDLSTKSSVKVKSLQDTAKGTSVLRSFMCFSNDTRKYY